MGASLLVFKNKSDVPGCMSEDDIREVCATRLTPPHKAKLAAKSIAGFTTRQHPDTQMAHPALLRHYRPEPTGRLTLGRPRRSNEAFQMRTERHWSIVSLLNQAVVDRRP